MVVLRLAVECPVGSVGQVSKQQTDETEDGSEGNGDVLADPAAGETQRKEPADLPEPSVQELLLSIAEQERVIAEKDRVIAELDRVFAEYERVLKKLSEPSPSITTETPTGKRSH